MKLNEFRIVFGEKSETVPDATSVTTFTTVTDWQGIQHTIEHRTAIHNQVIEDLMPLSSQLALMIGSTLELISRGEFKV